jgi:hypothetical protein
MNCYNAEPKLNTWHIFRTIPINYPLFNLLRVPENIVEKYLIEINEEMFQ